LSLEMAANHFEMMATIRYIAKPMSAPSSRETDPTIPVPAHLLPLSLQQVGLTL